MMKFICFLVGSGSLIGMMLVIRTILHGKIAPGILYMLWLIPALRLLFPLTLIPVPVLSQAAGEVLVPDGGDEEAAADHVSITDNGQETETVGTEGLTETAFFNERGEELRKEAKAEGIPVRRKAGIPDILSSVWLSGSILCGGYTILVNRRLKRNMKRMRRLTEKRPVPVYIRKEAVSPCLFGLFHPCILLPERTAGNRELCAQILLHEEAHYRQKKGLWLCPSGNCAGGAERRDACPGNYSGFGKRKKYEETAGKYCVRK